MTVYRDTTTARDVSTGDAAFRAWAQMIHDAMANVGLVNTSDTGQINLSTVTAPAGGAFAGYEIWRFNDAGQSGDPIYFKIEYGRAATTSRGTLRFTFGTGSDGAGTLSNAYGTTMTVTNSTPSGTPELHACHIDGTFVLTDNSSPTVQVGIIGLIIERSRDASGNVITSGDYRGWSVLTSGNLSSGNSVQRKGAVWRNSVAGRMHNHVTGVPTGSDADGRTRMSALIVGEDNPLLSVLIAKASEVASGDTGSATVLGTSHSYRVLTAAATNFGGAANDIGGSSNALSTKMILLADA